MAKEANTLVKAKSGDLIILQSKILTHGVQPFLGKRHSLVFYAQGSLFYS
jgi:hypothetical protein